MIQFKIAISGAQQSVAQLDKLRLPTPN